MFWKWYYKRFPVRVKAIAYNAIIILCHPVKVAIFVISNFFSLFWIAVFNIPISHIIIVLLFLLQSYCFFRYFQTFFNFFHFFRLDLPTITNFVFMLCLCSSLFRRCVFRRSWSWSWSCVRWSPDNHTYAHTYAHTHARARGFLDYKFLDITVIFRLPRNF